MTQNDRLEFARRVCAQNGQSTVAKRIGKSAPAVSQILNGKYLGSPDIILELIEAEFGTSAVECPVMGEIPLATCIEERDKPFKATSSQRVQLYRACQSCPHKGGVK